MDLPINERGIYVFGRFRLDRARRTLSCDETSLALPARLFDTLMYLVENAGRVVGQDELTRVIWAGRVVDETNVRQAIFSLRKALQTDGTDAGLIVTVPMRGYQFTGTVYFEPEPSRTVAEFSQPIAPSTSPPPPKPRRSLAKPLLAGGIAAALCAIMVGAYSRRQNSTAPFAPPPFSIAVLPFANLNGDAKQDYFSDGISEELIGSLSRIGKLHVAARSSAFAFKNKQASISDIARQLNVGSILEGSVRRDGNHLRLTAELVNATTGYSFWSRSYSSDNGDIFKTQQQIAEAVATSLQVALLGSDAQKLALGGTQNPQAFDAYLRGLKLTPAPSLAANQAAVAAFTEAITRDPHFALAYGHRSFRLTQLADLSINTDRAAMVRMLASAKDDAEKAVALAPGLAEGHLARAAAMVEDFDYIGAQREIALARDLAPGNPDILTEYASLQLAFGQIDAAVAAAKQVALDDPLTPSSYYYLANVLIGASQIDEARAAIQHETSLGSNEGANVLQPYIPLYTGQFATVGKDCGGEQSISKIVCLAVADHVLGRQDQAQSQLQALQARCGNNCAYQYAVIYAQWHDQDHAIQWLTTAYKLHDVGLLFMKVDLLLDPIRHQPQVQEIERQLHFPS